MTHQSDINAAYFQGMREGFDPEVAEDLGIPMTPEAVERHINSAQQVVAQSGNIAVRGFRADGQAEHDELDQTEGRVICASCNRPGCRGCGRS